MRRTITIAIALFALGACREMPKGPPEPTGPEVWEHGTAQAVCAYDSIVLSYKGRLYVAHERWITITVRPAAPGVSAEAVCAGEHAAYR